MAALSQLSSNRSLSAPRDALTLTVSLPGIFSTKLDRLQGLPAVTGLRLQDRFRVVHTEMQGRGVKSWKRVCSSLSSQVRPGFTASKVVKLDDLLAERDACGVGFIANLNNESSHKIVQDALTALGCMEHRGGCGADNDSGDGAGVMTKIPWILLQKWATDQGLPPLDEAKTGVGMVFLPKDETLAAAAKEVVERVFTQEGVEVLGWRSVPVNVSVVGYYAKITLPNIQQVLVKVANEGSLEEVETELYISRKLIEKAAESESWGQDLYMCSLSNSTVVYKGMLRSEALGSFYQDLQDPLFMSPFAIYHRRYSTNTNPRWPLAQPMRFLGHNGEINTLQGNLNWMRSRESIMKSAVWHTKRILDAACTCKLAVVILSEEFVCSMWPMIELSVFVDAMPSGVRILPLFFKLSPSDLNNESNLTRWVTSWELFAKQDSRIVVSKWKEALRILGLQNGLIFDAATEGELAYSYRIVASISQIIPSTIKYDTHYVHGKDRLCKVVLDKFKEMETQECNSVALPSSKDLSTIARPKVLGLYGLPGSGKSTICKCLQGCFFPIYPGKTLYLELPTNPSPAKLVNVFKMLLRLTDFRDKMDLDHRVLELEQVQFLLRSYQLQSCSVFLVIDNISDTSWEAVQRILHVGFGLNSKIILVARTFDILRPILNSLKREHHYICDSLCIPYIDEREAKEILMQTIRPGLGGYVPQRHLTPEQTEIILHIVRLCGFGPESSRVYLPLVMNIMGAMLVKYDGDLEEWGRDSQGFWTGVKSYKEDAVKKLVGESFKTLPNEEFQVLFMDVALFILPSGRLGYHEVRALLGFMHDKSASRMHKMLKDLERYCFLTVDENGIGVHDVYLDFAKSMQEDSSGFMKWSWRNDIYTDGGALLLKEEQTTKGEHQLVRTMILEVKGCEKVELQSFSGLKAVVIRGCKSLRVLRLSGLRSLVSLEIVRCASLQQIECGDNDYTSLRNVKRLKMEPQTKGEGSRMQEEQQVWHPFSYLLQWVIAPDKHSNVLNRGIASHMRGLQVLCLEETGIRRLDDMSSYWPQLQHINVIEDCLESFVVGKLLKLKRFHFNDVVAKEGDPDFYRKSESWKRRKGNPRFMLQGKNLLEGCPELEEVDIQSAFFEGDELGTLPQSIVALELSCFYTATKLPDLSLFHKLERLTLRCCEKLERVNLPVGLRNLKDLELSHCSNVVEVSGLGSLRSLRSLRVSGCPKLQPFVGSNNWRMLQEDPVCDFPLLSEQNRCVSLESLTNLEEL